MTDTLDTVLHKAVTDWQAYNSSLPTPEMLRFARCVYFALLGSKVVMLPPNLDTDELVRRVRLAVVSNPDCDAYVTALKSYRELTGMSLLNAKAWVNEHPDVTAASEDAEMETRARVRNAYDTHMDVAEKLLYNDIVRQIRTNPDAGSVVVLASMPLELTNERHGDIRAMRANHRDRARSLAVLYRIEGKRVVLLDVLTLPPIPKEPRP